MVYVPVGTSENEKRPEDDVVVLRLYETPVESFSTTATLLTPRLRRFTLPVTLNLL